MYARRTCGGRRPHPGTLRRKKHTGLSDLLPAGRELRFNRCLRMKKLLELQKKLLATTGSTMPCLDAPFVKKMSPPYDVTTTTTIPQSPSSVAELSSDQV
ncbi:hypothetical protein HA466_0258420 [Hirschfeldia incana]|nr:hypothetical protein HA466_0258420 [Hirschfeldia incana]